MDSQGKNEIYAIPYWVPWLFLDFGTSQKIPGFFKNVKVPPHKKDLPMQISSSKSTEGLLISR